MSSILVDQEYLDETLEPNRKLQIPDVLWRSIRAPRGGRRGLATKVRHINEGIAQGYYQGTYPFVTRDGLEYAKQWKFQVSNSVLQGATVWEVETSSSEGRGSDLGKASCKSSPNSESVGTGSDLGGDSCKSSTNFESIRTSRLPNRLIIVICCATGKI